jgi:heme oxygenase
MDFVKAFLLNPLTEESFLKGHETLYPWLSSIYRESVRHFGGLKMSFFNGHETLEP